MCIAFHGKLIAELRSVTCHMWSHSVTCRRHRWTHFALTPAKRVGSRLTYPGGMEGWVDFGVGYVPRWFICPQIVTHSGNDHLIAATRAGVKPILSRQTDRPVCLSFCLSVYVCLSVCLSVSDCRSTCVCACASVWQLELTVSLCASMRACACACALVLYTSSHFTLAVNGSFTLTHTV